MKQFSVNLVAILSLTTFLVNLHFTKAERIQCNDGIDHLLKDVNEDIKARSPVKQTNKGYCDELVIEGAYTMVRNGDIYGEHVGGEDDCFKQDFNILMKILNFTCVVNMEMIQKAAEEQANKFISRKKRNFPTMDDIPDKPSGVVFGFWEDAKLKGVQHRKIYIKQPNNKNLDQNPIERLWEELKSYTGKIFLNGNSDRSFARGIGEYSDTELPAYRGKMARWVAAVIIAKVCITGEIMICRANKEATNTDKLSMCMPINMDKCIINCRGDAQLEGMCEQTSFMDDMKEKFSVVVLAAAQGEIKKSLTNSPTGLVEKFNCEKLS